MFCNRIPFWWMWNGFFFLLLFGEFWTKTIRNEERRFDWDVGEINMRNFRINKYTNIISNPLRMARSSIPSLTTSRMHLSVELVDWIFHANKQSVPLSRIPKLDFEYSNEKQFSESVFFLLFFHFLNTWSSCVCDCLYSIQFPIFKYWHNGVNLFFSIIIL